MDIQNIISELALLDASLQLHTQKLAAFNAAYLLVTKNFANALQENFFSEPAQVEKLDVAFAQYYFRAIDAEKLPLEWQTVQQRAILEPSKLFSLLLGANVHIHHDLPLALLETIEKPEIFERDYFKAQSLFKKSIQQILLQYEPKSLKTFRGKIILMVTTFTILHWRKTAWKSFLALREKKITHENLLMATLQTAQKIQKLEKHLARYGIF